MDKFLLINPYIQYNDNGTAKPLGLVSANDPDSAVEQIWQKYRKVIMASSSMKLQLSLINKSDQSQHHYEINLKKKGSKTKYTIKPTEAERTKKKEFAKILNSEISTMKNIKLDKNNLSDDDITDSDSELTLDDSFLYTKSEKKRRLAKEQRQREKKLRKGKKKQDNESDIIKWMYASNYYNNNKTIYYNEPIFDSPNKFYTQHIILKENGNEVVGNVITINV